MATSLTNNFTLEEFQGVSNRDLTAMEQVHALWHAEILQLVRNELNRVWAAPEVGGQWQVHLTSFVRSESRKDHGTGAAVDWNVRDRNGKRYDTLTKWARDWLAQSHGSRFAELIWEPAFEPDEFAHVHHARRDFSVDESANVAPQILDETEPGVFVAAVIGSIPAPARPIALAVALVGVLFLLDGLL
jgi:predicted Rdx family selenoprotein